MLSEQYVQIADILDGSAEKLGSDLHFDTDSEKLIRKKIKSWGIDCNVLCYRDKNGLMRVEICGKNLTELCVKTEELTLALSELININLSCPEQMMGKSLHALSFKEECGYTCAIGAAAEKRDKNSISGDCGTYFYGDDGKLNIILCDGMGSGAEAAKESKRTLKLVESFLRAGVEPKHAVKIINSAILCSNDSASFSTLDITVINPNSCVLTTIKCGAVQSYIRRERPKGGIGVLEIGARKSSGFNIQSLLSPVCSQFQLKDGDMVILLSDGVCI
jgi:stage II sporulation protein E